MAMMGEYSHDIISPSSPLVSEWGDLHWHSNKVRLLVTMVMSDHPAVVDKAMFYPETAIQIGDNIITTDSE